LIITAASASVDCSSTLKLPSSPITNQYLKENKEEEQYRIGKGSNSFFENTNESKCPITSCSLKQKGCKTKYNGNKLDIIPIEFDFKGNPYFFGIEAKNFTTNWNEKVCY